MSDQPEDPVLAYLRRFDAKLDGVRAGLTDLEQHLTALETQLGQHASTQASHYAGLATRFDRIEGHVVRLERRAGILPA